jgi:ABC-type iron transport system FetAB ATPase subunit
MATQQSTNTQQQQQQQRNDGAPPRLAVRDLRSAHGGPFNFTLQAGECVAIQGPSGAGKSVLLRMLADLDPHDGDALLDGRPARATRGPPWRAQVVYQGAEPAWWETTGRAHFPPEHLPFALRTLAALGMDAALLDSEIERLSTGERQRLALVRSLACAPRVLLLDEPTAALDPASVARAEALLQECLAGGAAILIVTHSAEQARRLGKRLFRLEKGRLSPHDALPDTTAGDAT